MAGNPIADAATFGCASRTGWASFCDEGSPTAARNGREADAPASKVVRRMKTHSPRTQSAKVAVFTCSNFPAPLAAASPRSRTRASAKATARAKAPNGRMSAESIADAPPASFQSGDTCRVMQRRELMGKMP